MKKLFLISALLLICLLAFVYIPKLILKNAGVDLDPQYSDDAIHKALIYTAEEMSEELPKTIDVTTTLMSVTVSDPSVRKYSYKYFVNTDLFGGIANAEKMKDFLLIAAKNQFCTDPSQEFFRKNNVTVEHRYFNQENIYLFFNRVSNADCVN
jgi:hypothetical protein